jgi:DNA adenine methylase
MIDAAERAWRKEGKRTRRNWWEVLAGDKDGNPRRVRGIQFPVIEVIRRRQVHSRRGASAKAKPVVQTFAALAKTVAARRGKAFPAAPQVRQPRPFVKWAGGKRQLLPAILDCITKPFRTYHEPFLGGGAVFFALSPPKAFLSDSNRRLVRCYTGIRNNVRKVITLLKSYRQSREFFLELREKDIDSATDAEVAAWFIFLNKTGYNGLYRVNSKNKFNVPYGANKNPEICDEDNLKACSRALGSADLSCEGFEAVLERAKAGDLVYFDPPYVPLSSTSYFTSYTAGGFTHEDQLRLRNIALKLKDNDVTVLLSNSSKASELYADGFEIQEVLAARALNSNAERRGKITELLIR